MKNIIYILTTIIFLRGNALAEGTAKFSIDTNFMSFEISQKDQSTNSLIDGYTTGFGNTSGKVKLSKVDNNLWEGVWGKFRISTKNFQISSDHNINFRIYVLGAGIYNFYFKNTEGFIEVSATDSNGHMVHSYFDGYEWSESSFQFSSSMKNNLNGEYHGFSIFQNEDPKTLQVTKLLCTEDLDLIKVIQDPVLYSLLYVLPLILPVSQ